MERLKRNPTGFYSSLENINGDSGFACPAACANGRNGKAGLAGGAGGSSPVSAQSTTKASEMNTSALLSIVNRCFQHFVK